MANIKILEQKQLVIDEIKEKFSNAKSVVLFDPRGLKVSEVTELRRTLRESGSDYKVYKNTMINFAIKGTEFEDLSAHLEGPTALAVSKDDATAPARILYNAFISVSSSLRLFAFSGCGAEQKSIALSTPASSILSNCTFVGNIICS